MEEVKKIFNENKTKELSSEDIDLELGYLENDILEVHHDAVQAQEEEGHYVTIAEYENGGKDVQWVVDKPKIEGKEAYVERLEIQVFKRYSEEELKRINDEKRLEALKKTLADTDYKAIKYAEGYYTEEEYQPIKEHRESLREQIRSIIDNKDNKEG